MMIGKCEIFDQTASIWDPFPGLEYSPESDASLGLTSYDAFVEHLFQHQQQTMACYNRMERHQHIIDDNRNSKVPTLGMLDQAYSMLSNLFSREDFISSSCCD